MDLPRLGAVSNLYGISPVLLQEEVSDIFFPGYNKLLAKLAKVLGDDREAGFWVELLSSLRKYRFEILTTPLPYNQIFTEEFRSNFTRSIQYCQSGFPEYEELLVSIFSSIESLSDDAEHPYFVWLKDNLSEINDNGKVNLGIFAAKFIPVVEEYLSKQSGLEAFDVNVINPRQLREPKVYRKIVFCGPVQIYSHYTPHVWRSPRASESRFLSLPGSTMSFVAPSSFNNNLPATFIEVKMAKLADIRTEDLPGEQEGGELIPNELKDIFQPSLPVIGVHTGNSSINNKHGGDLVLAKMICLEDGSYIYKLVEGKSQIVTFEPAAEIRQVQNVELDVESYLMVRTEGAGSSVAVVADMLMGDQSVTVRSKQSEWKDKFREVISSEYSIQPTILRLKDLGSGIANEVNVKNWRMDETIKPKNRTDFDAIMKLIGLQSRAEELWGNASLIHSMHVKAGHLIGKRLREKLDSEKLADLHKYGRVDITLKGIVGKLSVIRVIDISDQTFDVPVGMTNTLFH